VTDSDHPIIVILHFYTQLLFTGDRQKKRKVNLLRAKNIWSKLHYKPRYNKSKCIMHRLQTVHKNNGAV